MDLRGSHVVITGASRGIGEAIADCLASRGAHLTLVARPSAHLNAVAARVKGNAYGADLADASQVANLIIRLEEDAGAPIDILINNAGMESTKSFLTTSADEVQRIHQVNLLSPIELTRQVLPGMVRRGRGHIVNVSSMASVGGFPGFSVYGSSKAGLSNFTRILRHDLRKTPIGLTSVEVGPVPTDLLSEINAYLPADQSFRRFRRLQLLPNVSRERVASSIVTAIEQNKRHVWLPSRAAPFAMCGALPQLLVDNLLRGIET
jgi:uncharacterized protein